MNAKLVTLAILVEIFISLTVYLIKDHVGANISPARALSKRFVKCNCSPNCAGVPENTTGLSCNVTSGECFHGCKGKFTGAACQICKRGWTGDQCQFKCDFNCDNCTWDDTNGTVKSGCNLCRPRYYHTPGECKFCSPGCLSNTTSDLPKCDQMDGTCAFGCQHGTYGPMCGMACSSFCLKKLCARSDGCCSEGCEKPGRGGCKCTEPCGINCFNSTCYQNKTCRKGCTVNHWGSTCDKKCSKTCNEPADNSTSSCNISGICAFGCQRAFMGLTCEKHCPETCLEQGCDQTSGECLQGCIAGYHGRHCNLTCNSNCQENDCYYNGTCKNCRAGLYGHGCADLCPKTCLNGTCDRDDGTCMVGCIAGLAGPVCDQVVDSKEPPEFDLRTILDPVLYAVAGLVLLGLVLLIICKRRLCQRLDPKTKDSYKNFGKTGESYEDIQRENRGHSYGEVTPRRAKKSNERNVPSDHIYETFKTGSEVNARPPIANEYLEMANMRQPSEEKTNTSVQAHAQREITGTRNKTGTHISDQDNDDPAQFYENLDVRLVR